MTVPTRAATDLEAANLALSIVEEPPISGFDEPDRTAAREVSKWYAVALDNTLSKTDWNCATAYATPAVDAVAGAGLLKKRYPLPGDCVKVRSVDGLEADEWAVETAIVNIAGADVEAKVLVCNIAAPNVCYTRRITNVALWDSDFLTAFAHRLAHYCAPKLGFSFASRRALKEDANEEADAAAAADAREKAPSQISRDTSWIRARRGVR